MGDVLDFKVCCKHVSYQLVIDVICQIQASLFGVANMDTSINMFCGTLNEKYTIYNEFMIFCVSFNYQVYVISVFVEEMPSV